MARARTVAEVIAGEAVSGTPEERIADMRAIASVIANRAALLGVTPQQVIANSREFNAYNKSLPPGVNQDIVDLAQQQIDYVAENGPVNNATFYATPAAADNLPNGLNYETATTGHQYFSDPQNRSIGTSEGFVKPNQYAYAQNLDEAGIPTPYAADDPTNGSLLSAFSETPTYQDDPFSSILSGQKAPAETWSTMASAKPVQAPMDSVAASGILGGNPALEASTRAVPMMNVPASGSLASNAPLDAAATVNVATPATVSERMGIAEPGFDNSRFDGLGPSVATDFDPGRFGDPVTASFDPSRFGAPTIDPATNTQSFTDQPSAPAQIAGFSDAYAAQRGPTSGILSADHQALQGLAEKQVADAAMAKPALSVPSAGILAGNQPLEEQSTVPSLASSYVAPQAVTPAEQAIDNVTTASTTPNILSGSLLSTANAPLSFTPSPGIIGAQPVQQNQFVSSFPTAVAQNQIEPATVNDVVAAPTLDTIQVSEQPAISNTPVDIPGPATTNALDTQKSQAITKSVTQQEQPTVQAAQNTKSFKDSLLSKETALGGILGGLVAGPPGAILGGIVGQQTAQGGGLTGLLSSGFSAPTTQIAGGSANIGGILGGSYAPGTFAVANNGARITAQNGGYTSMVTPSGQHEVISPTGQISHNFGSIL